MNNRVWKGVFGLALVFALAFCLVRLSNQLSYACGEECPTPTPTPAPDQSHVSFCSNPSGSEVWLDYSYRGDTSLDLTISVGSHHIGFYKAGYHGNTALEDDFTLGDSSMSIGGDMVNGQIVSNCPISVSLTPTPNISPTPTPTEAPAQTPSNNSGGGGGSTTNAPSCGNQKPGLPYNLLAVAGPGAEQVTLTWGPPVGSVSDYSIVYSDDPSVQKWGVISTGNSRNYTISSLAVNKYYFWVKAVNGCMPGDSIGPVSVGGTGGPDFGPAVLGLSTTSGGKNSVFVFTQLLGAFVAAFTGYIFFKKNA